MKYYWIAYCFKNYDGILSFENEILKDILPMSWIKTRCQYGTNYQSLISWQEITEEEYNLWR
jgi:hypothetical protein